MQELEQVGRCSFATGLVEECGAGGSAVAQVSPCPAPVWAECHSREEVLRMRDMQVEGWVRNGPQVEALRRSLGPQGEQCQVFQRCLTPTLSSPLPHFQPTTCSTMARYLTQPAVAREQCTEEEREAALVTPALVHILVYFTSTCTCISTCTCTCTSQGVFQRCSHGVAMGGLAPLPHLPYPAPLALHLCSILDKIKVCYT